MNSLTYLKALYTRRWLIVVITCIAFILSIVKVFVIPPNNYEAETVLIVSSPHFSGDFDKIMADVFNPKIFEELALSPTVLQEVLDKLASSKAFGTGKTPKLEDFREDLAVGLNTVDKTTRPINYSPLLTIKAETDTPELSKAIVNTWANILTDSARKTNHLRLGIAAESLMNEEKEQKNALERIWADRTAEKEKFDVDFAEHEMLLRLELLYGTVPYKEEEEDDMENIPLPQNADQPLIIVPEKEPGFFLRANKTIGLRQIKSSVEQELAEAEARLGAVRESLGSDDYSKAHRTVTPELSTVYLHLKLSEQKALQTVASAKAKLDKLNSQITQIRDEMDISRAEIAVHEAIQSRVDIEEKTASLAFREIAQARSQASTVAHLVSKEQSDGTGVLGLNRMSDTVAVQRKVLLGKKSTVIVFTFVAFALSTLLVLVQAVLNPLLAKIKE